MKRELHRIHDTFQRFKPTKDILKEMKDQMTNVTLKYFPNETNFNILLDPMSWSIVYYTSIFEIRFLCDSSYLNMDHIKFDKNFGG